MTDRIFAPHTGVIRRAPRTLARTWLRLWLSLYLAFTGPARERVIIVVLAGYAALWGLFGAISKFGQWVHGDSAEIFVWSRYLELGYDKHPPLLPLIYAGWFSVMPVATWSLHLLAGINAAIGLWAVWKAAGLMLDPRRQVIATASLALMPFYAFHALQFNHNAILLSLWPLAGWCMLLSLRGQWRGTAGLGVAIALSMLAKYNSVTLIAALGLGALFHPMILRYLRSPHPYVAAAIALVILGPHLIWASGHQFQSVQLAAERYRIEGAETLSGSGLHYIGTAAAMLSLWAGAMIAGLWRPFRAGPSIAAPADERRVVAVVALAVALAPLAQLGLGLRVPTPWMYSTFFWLPLAVLAWRWPRVALRAPVVMTSLAALLAIGAVLAAPLATYMQMRRGATTLREPRIELAEKATEIFRAETGERLAIVAGGIAVHSVAFHSPDHPLAFSTVRPRGEFTWLTDRRIDRSGMLLICGAEETACIAGAMTMEPTKRVELSLQRGLFGIDGKVYRYVLMVVPPFHSVMLPETPLERCAPDEPSIAELDEWSERYEAEAWSFIQKTPILPEACRRGR